MIRPWTLDDLEELAGRLRQLSTIGSSEAIDARNRMGKAVAPLGVELFALVRAARAYRDSRVEDHFDQAEIDLLNALAALEDRLRLGVGLLAR